MRDQGRQRIMDAIDEHFIRQMRNWVRSGGSGNLYAMSAAYDGGVDQSAYAQSPLPILGGEAEDVDASLCALALRYRLAVTLFWWYEGASLPHLARRCGTGVDYRTYQTRVMRGHDDLRAELHRRRAMFDRLRAHAQQATSEHVLTRVGL